jgi:hypothetical protein
MALVFPNVPGRAVIIPPKSVVGQIPLVLRLEGWGGPQTMKAIVLELSLRFRGHQQFLHTLRDFIYVYSFGEGMGEATMSGLAFAETCTDPNGTTGSAKIIEYYSDNRLSTTGEAVKFTLGNSPTFYAYLTSMSLKARVAEQLNLTDFTLSFHIPPGGTNISPGIQLPATGGPLPPVIV